MTLPARNTVFKGEMIFSFLCLLVCIAASVRVIPVYPSLETEIALRSRGIFHAFFENSLTANLLAAHCCIAVSVLYSFLTVILIYFFFEKTQSPEILFVAFFAASFSPETLRLILPLGRVYEIPSLYALMASRITLFFRCFGIFSLFAAGVYAAGFETQRQRNTVMIIVVTSLVIALGVPVDIRTWDTALNPVNGYMSMFRLIEAGIFLISTVSFFIAARSRGSREFAFIGAGSVLVFFGRSILLASDTWAGLFAGPALLAFGTWLICTRLHKVYLWL
jgi:hypothetical protein